MSEPLFRLETWVIHHESPSFMPFYGMIYNIGHSWAIIGMPSHGQAGGPSSRRRSEWQLLPSVATWCLAVGVVDGWMMLDGL